MSQVRNGLRQDWSRPICWRSCSTAAGSAMSPSITCAGSPGTSRTNANTVIATRTGWDGHREPPDEKPNMRLDSRHARTAGHAGDFTSQRRGCGSTHGVSLSRCCANRAFTSTRCRSRSSARRARKPRAFRRRAPAACRWSWSPRCRIISRACGLSQTLRGWLALGPVASRS